VSHLSHSSPPSPYTLLDWMLEIFSGLHSCPLTEEHMAISRTYTINGLNITVSAQPSIGNPGNVLVFSATASYTPSGATSPITASETWTWDPTQPQNIGLSTAQMQVQCEQYLQSLANRLATLIMLYNTAQLVV